MRTENDNGAIGYLVQFFYKNCTSFPQIFHNVPVMHDLMPHVNWRTEQFECAFDDGDGTVNSGAKTARIG